MRKNIIKSVALVLAVGLMTVGVLPQRAVAASAVQQDFSSKPTVGVDAGGGNVTTAYIPKSNLYEIKVGNPNGGNVFGTLNIAPIASTFWGAQGISIYVKTADDIAFQLDFMGGSQRYYLPDGQNAASVNAGSQQLDISYRNIFVPANFEGEINIPFSLFEEIGNSASRPGSTQLSSPGTVFLEFNCSTNTGKSMYMGDIKLYGNYEKTVENFDAAQSVTVDNYSNTATAPTITAADNNGKKSVAFTGGDGATMTVFNNAVLGDISGYTGIKFYYKNTGNELPNTLHFFDSSSPSERFISKQQADVYTCTPLGGSSFSYAGWAFPGNFEGYVTVPFSNFQSRHDNGSDNGTIDGNAGALMMETFANSLNVNALFDDISLYTLAPVQTAIFDAASGPDSLNTWVWAGGGSLNINKNMALSLTPQSKNPDSYCAVNFQIAGGDWTGKKGVELSIKNDAAADVNFRFAFEDGGERWQADDTKKAVFKAIDGTLTESCAGIIPASFEGIITIPFESFKKQFAFATENNVIDFASITGMAFIEMSTVDANKTIILKNISVVDSYEKPAAPTENVDVGDLRLLKTFNSGDFTSTNSHMEAYANGGQVNVSAATGFNSTGGMRLDIGGKNPTTNDIWAAISSFNLNKNDWSQYKGIQFWAKNSGITDVTFDFAFEEQSTERWITNNAGVLVYKDAATGKETMKLATPKGIVLPAGFEGNVRIPFESLQTAEWSRKNGVMELSNVTGIVITSNCNENSGKSFIIDNIALYKTDFEITTRFNSTVKPWLD